MKSNLWFLVPICLFFAAIFYLGKLLPPKTLDGSVIATAVRVNDYGSGFVVEVIQKENTDEVLIMTASHVISETDYELKVLEVGPLPTSIEVHPGPVEVIPNGLMVTTRPKEMRLSFVPYQKPKDKIDVEFFKYNPYGFVDKINRKRAKLIYFGSAEDISLMKVEVEKGWAKPVQMSQDFPKRGDKLISCGCSMGSPPIVKSGMFGGWMSNGDTERGVFTGGVVNGDSGCAVFNDKYEVVGMAVAYRCGIIPIYNLGLYVAFPNDVLETIKAKGRENESTTKSADLRK